MSCGMVESRSRSSCFKSLIVLAAQHLSPSCSLPCTSDVTRLAPGIFLTVASRSAAMLMISIFEHWQSTRYSILRHQGVLYRQGLIQFLKV